MSVVVSLFVLLGAGFALVAGIGVVRMPDLFCRMHAATKAGSFGVALLLVGLAIAAPGWRTFFEGILIVSFFYLTAPVGAQMIARAAQKRNVQVWRVQDDGSDKEETADG